MTKHCVYYHQISVVFDELFESFQINSSYEVVKDCFIYRNSGEVYTYLDSILSKMEDVSSDILSLKKYENLKPDFYNLLMSFVLFFKTIENVYNINFIGICTRFNMMISDMNTKKMIESLCGSIYPYIGHYTKPKYLMFDNISPDEILLKKESDKFYSKQNEIIRYECFNEKIVKHDFIVTIKDSQECTATIKDSHEKIQLNYSKYIKDMFSPAKKISNFTNVTGNMSYHDSFDEKTMDSEYFCSSGLSY